MYMWEDMNLGPPNFEKSDFPTRPDSFSFDPKTFASYDGTGCRPSFQLRFSDADRYFVVHAFLGDGASELVQQEALGVLDSLEVETAN